MANIHGGRDANARHAVRGHLKISAGRYRPVAAEGIAGAERQAENPSFSQDLLAPLHKECVS
jgi:hypothetical protein